MLQSEFKGLVRAWSNNQSTASHILESFSSLDWFKTVSITDFISLSTKLRTSSLSFNFSFSSNQLLSRFSSSFFSNQDLKSSQLL